MAPRRLSLAKIAAVSVMLLLAVWLLDALLKPTRSPVAVSPSTPSEVLPLPTPFAGSLPSVPPGLPLAPIMVQTLKVDERGAIVERRQGQAQMFREDLGGGVTLEMLAIPGGAFRMGSPSTEADRLDSEGPATSVTVAPFFMGRFEVTQAQWRTVAAFSRIGRDLAPDPSAFKAAERPVEQVSWLDAVEFCQRLSKKTGREYRLPSEAEWEYAARAGTQTPFAFGATITPALVNYDGGMAYGAAPKGPSRQGTTRVGELGVPNVFGLFDMHGNVWEWVQDAWHPSYVGRPNDGRVWDQGGDLTGRVLRGGAWFDYARTCRSAARYQFGPEDRNINVGFRLACTVPRTQ